MKKKNLIKIVPLIAITLLALTSGFSSVAFADSTTTSSSVEMKRGLFKYSPMAQGGGVLGTVTGITGTNISVKDSKGVLFSVDASTAKLFKDFASTTIAITDIKVGDSVMVRGTTVGVNVKAAVVIAGKFTHRGLVIGKHHGWMHKEDADDKGKRGFGVRGVVTTISGSNLTLNAQNSTTYNVDASNAVIFKGQPKATSTLSEIKSGDSVIVRGVVNGTTITATTIIDGITQKDKMGKHKYGFKKGEDK